KGPDVGDAGGRAADRFVGLDNFNRPRIAVERCGNDPRVHEYRRTFSADNEHGRIGPGNTRARPPLVLLVANQLTALNHLDLRWTALGRDGRCRFLFTYARPRHKPAHVLVRRPHWSGSDNGLLSVAGPVYRGGGGWNSRLRRVSPFLSGGQSGVRRGCLLQFDRSREFDCP